MILNDFVSREAQWESPSQFLFSARGKNLSYASFARTDLHKGDFEGARLYCADLRGANLSGSNLRNADLRSANLAGANLRGADMRGVRTDGANLTGAVMSRSQQ